VVTAEDMADVVVVFVVFEAHLSLSLLCAPNFGEKAHGKSA